ncbi:MAG: cyanophycin synthetase [Pseudomonadota bacterium]
MIRRVPYPKFGTGIGLHRVAGIAERLHIDLAAFGANAAVITGSNGKGSTAAMLSSILAETGESVGRFTSPHLLALNERFALDGEDISDQDLGEHWARVDEAARAWLATRDEQLGGFEFLFVVAASWFAARQPHYTVWEAGIGGRYDPTRLIQPRRTALVSLDLEHTALLGDTLEQIAFDKLDAAPEGAIAFCGETAVPLRERIEAYCKLRGVTAQFVAQPTLSLAERVARDSAPGEGRSNMQAPDVLARPSPPTPSELPLAGLHQQNNAALALALARDMADINEVQIATGLAQTRWPGRLEILSTSPLVVIDVGHTPAAIISSLDGFAQLAGERARVLVCGASHDKAAAEMIALLAPAFPRIVCTAARHKGAPPAEIARAAAAANPDAELIIADDVAEASKIAHTRAQSEGAVYVAGGLFLAAEFKAVDLGLDPAALVFF